MPTFADRVFQHFYATDGSLLSVSLTHDQIADLMGMEPWPDGPRRSAKTPRRSLDRVLLRLVQRGLMVLDDERRYSATSKTRPPGSLERRRPRTTPLGYAGAPALERLVAHYDSLTERPFRTSRILRARIVAASQRADVTLTEVAKRAGLGKSCLTRKLFTDSDRALFVDDLDLFQRVLDLEPDELLQPVLLSGDLEILALAGELATYDDDGRVTGGLSAPPPGWDRGDVAWRCARSRLCAQGLAWVEAGVIVLSPLGVSTLNDPLIRNT